MWAGKAYGMDAEKQDYVGDLKRKTRWELIELLERQKKIILNRALVTKLPDKGKKVRERITEIKELLQAREKSMDNTTELLAALKVSSKTDENMDSDDDDDGEIENKMNKIPNVFETLATNTSAAQAKKIFLGYDGEKSGFYPKLTDDLDEITTTRESKINQLNKPKHSTREHRAKLSTKEKKTAIEESAVVYTIGPHAEGKMLSLNDSIKLQQDYVKNLKEIEKKEASLKLRGMAKINITEYQLDPAMKMNYRENNDEDITDLD